VQIRETFLRGFRNILRIDGQEHEFTFSTPDGNSSYSYPLTVLWIRDTSQNLGPHTHGMNVVAYQDVRVFQMLEEDVPDGARLIANDFLTIDGTQYRIMSARIKDGIWNVMLSTTGTT
jgi:hypothetical protein